MSKQTFSRDSLVLIDSKTIQKVACSSTHLNDLHLYCIYKESNKEIQNRMILMIYLLDKIKRIMRSEKTIKEILFTTLNIILRFVNFKSITGYIKRKIC